MLLGAGENTTLTAMAVTITIEWTPQDGMRELDAVAVVLGAPGSVRDDADLVFFNAPTHPRGIATVDVTVLPGRAVIAVDLTRCTPSDERLVLAVSNDAGPLLPGAPLRVSVDAAGASLAWAELTAVGTESALVLLELYRRQGAWKLRALGQGYDGGLAALVTDYGFHIEEQPTPRVQDPHPAPRRPAPASTEPRPFALWGLRSTWCGQEVNGTEHRQADILQLLPPEARTEQGADRDTTAVLLPEPGNPFDRHAVAVEVDGVRVGYLPAEVAPLYSPGLLDLVHDRLVPEVPVHLWARAYDDYDEQLDGSYVIVRRHHTRVAVALADPELIRPINQAPPGRCSELPVGGSVKVAGTGGHLAALTATLSGRALGYAYATLHRTEVTTARTTKPVIEVRIDNHAVGTLTPQMSTAYLPVVDHLAAAGTATAARALIQGSPVSVAVALHAVRAHEVSAEWLHSATS